MDERAFSEKLLSGAVEANLASYRKLFTETKIERAADSYWKSALAFFEKLNQKDREVFFSILRQVSVDSVSNVLGAIDGSSDIGLNRNVRLVDQDGKIISGSLQDHFLLGAVERE